MSCTPATATSKASRRCISLKQPVEMAEMHRLVRRWGALRMRHAACEVLTLNLQPLDVLSSDDDDFDDDDVDPVHMRDYSESLNAQTVQHLGQLQQFGLCLAAPEIAHYEDDDDENVDAVIALPWVRALLTAPRQLRLLSLEIYYVPWLPHYEGLQHLLLFVRRRIGLRACDAIGNLPMLETLCISGARYTLETIGDAMYSLAMPALDLRGCRRLRAAAFLNAVPARLQLPDNGCRCSMEAAAVSLNGWWDRGPQCCDAVTVDADERRHSSESLGKWLTTPFAWLTRLNIACETLSACSIDLPALRELHMNAKRHISVTFRGPLRLTALSIVTHALESFGFDSPEGLAQHLGWFHIRIQRDGGGAAFLQPLLDARKARGLRRWHMQETYRSSHPCHKAGQDGRWDVRAVLAYFPTPFAATLEEKPRGRCWCGGACHECLKAAGVMRAEVCMPAMPDMIVGLDEI